MFDVGFFPAIAGHAHAWMLNFSPRLRDALTRGFWIGEEIAHAKAAKVANPTTLLTRFAEELRRAPEAGGWF
jgi:hypothetical protein